MAADRPNLLFLMTDHQRADSIGMVQAGLEVTPNLNRLAAEGTRFTRAYNTCPLCVPARTALATGLYPTRNGVTLNDWEGDSAGNHKPIHQYLHEAGYDVAHVGVHHIRVHPELRQRVPFAKWIDPSHHTSYLKQHGVEKMLQDWRSMQKQVLENEEGEKVPTWYSSPRTMVWPHPAELHRDWFFADEAVEFIRLPHQRPFALFVCMWAPHPPLFVPEPFASMFSPAAVDLPPNVGLPAEGEPAKRCESVPRQLAEGISLEEWRLAWAAHLGLANLADDGIGRCLRALEESDAKGNTLVVFTTDHGEHLGQHRMYLKNEMYEQAVRVPLIMRGPAVRVQTVDAMVSHLDVLPTLLENAGVPVPEGLDGTSLLPALNEGAALPERTLHCQYSGNGRRGHIRRAVFTRRHKYVFDPSDAPELYDLQKDPLEMRNLASDSDHAGILTDLHERARTWGKAHGDWVSY